MSIIDQSEPPKSGTRIAAVDLTLRTQQIVYLEYLSERDDSPLSHALGKIIDKAMLVIVLEQGRPTRKVRKHFSMSPAHVAFIDRLSVKWGIPRSDVARRLIDEALAKDPGL